MTTNGTILVVEDDLDTREMMTMWLRCEGYHVTEAANGREALTVLEHEVPCAMVVDLHMPIMDGAALRRQLVESPSLASIPFILVSASGDSARVALELGIDDVIPKPFDSDVLLTAIATHCQCDPIQGCLAPALPGGAHRI